MKACPLFKLILVLVAFSWYTAVMADGTMLRANGLIRAAPQGVPTSYLSRIELGDPEAVEGALKRAENFYFKERANQDVYSPVVLVIYGSEVGIFFKENYSMYKSIVDLAARLSAFKVIDIRVCETSAQGLGLDLKTLFPFVNTVNYGPAEVVRLIDVEKYTYF
jgi:intracellular sulfur oxidation DsrE/DsrF family protein